jgi:hypothetical protein
MAENQTNTETAVVEVKAVPMKHEVTATVLAALASFVAGKVVNQAYTKYIVERGPKLAVEVVETIKK